MAKAEYPGDGGCPQRDSAEHEEYAGARSIGGRETGEADGADLLERILSRENLNRAYKRVKANKGAPGIDGMTVEDALPWLREHREELLEQIREGKYKPQPVRRKEIPKPDGGIRKLGIPTVVDRIIQQAIAQQLTPIFEPLFSDGSYGYRPGRSAQMAIQKVKEYAEQGYTTAVLIDLSKYFDTLNHELLMNMVREEVHDKRVVELIKRFLKSGVMEDGLHMKTKEGSPQGGPLSPLLANIYLNKFDHEMEGRGVHVIRYADDIVVLARTPRAGERLLESSRRYLEGKLPEESQRETERTDFPQSGQKRPESDEECKSLHMRMAWLLRNSKYAKDDERMGRMAAPEVPDVYLETVEGTEGKGGKSGKARRSQKTGSEVELCERILADSRQSDSHDHHNEQKTRTGGILQYPRPVRVSALIRLNRRVRNRTHGGVGGRSLK